MSIEIVWIEDDVDIIEPVVRPLERAGYRLHRVRSASEALECIDLLRSCDLILLDLILPSGETAWLSGRYPGIMLLEKLRSEFAVDTRVVVFSVVSNLEVNEALRRLDVKEIINKPILPSELKRRVEEVLVSQE